MKLNYDDTIALLDALLLRDSEINNAGFVARLRRLRQLVAEKKSAEVPAKDIGAHVFPGVAANSIRTMRKEFQDTLRAEAVAAGLDIRFIRPDARGKNAETDLCHFEGKPIPRDKELKELTANAVAIRPETPLVRSRIATFRVSGVPPQLSANGREPLHFFVSYAHHDAAQALKLLKPLIKDLQLSKDFAYEFWRDHLIHPGEQWHKEIDDALENCDFGLALISRDYLSSPYITEHELPKLVNRDKPLIPVCLGLLDFSRQNLRGLQEQQIYRYPSKPGEMRSFSECRAPMTERFVADLAKSIEERVKKAVTDRKQALMVRAAFEPKKLAALEVENPEFHRALGTLLDQASIDSQPQKHIDKASAELPTGRPASSSGLLRRLAANMLPPRQAAAVRAAAATLKLSETQRIVNKDNNDADQGLAVFERERFDALDYFSAWLRNPAGTAFAAVLGEIGSGKTTMLQMLARELMSEASGEGPPIFFVDLRDYIEDQNPTLENLLKDQLRRHDRSGKLTPEDIIKAVQTGGGLIIFDGLDEKIIPLADGPRQRFITELFRVLPANIVDLPSSSGRGRIIISCRSHYFPSVLALASGMTGQGRETVKVRDYSACIMLPWREDQIGEYLRQTLVGHKVEDALEIIGSIHNLADLSRRPYLLSLIVPQLDRLKVERAAGQLVNAASLYQGIVEEWLVRDEGKHIFAKEHKLLMMECLAADLWRDNVREWPWPKVADWLDDFLYTRPRIANRYAGRNLSTEILNADFRTATFFLRPDSAKDSFRFAHTSLQEYFLGCHLVKALAARDNSAWDLPTPSLETLDFMGQILLMIPEVDKQRALAGWQALLERATAAPRARAAAFALLVHAHRHQHPCPAHAAVQGQGLDLAAWDISGSPGNPLRLAKADFSAAILIRSQWRHVELADSRWQAADLRNAEMVDVGLARADFSTKDESCRTRLEGLHLRAIRLSGSRINGARLDGLRVALPTWDDATEEHWRENCAGYQAARIPGNIRCWRPPLATGSLAPCVTTKELGAHLDAIWSLGHASAVSSVAFSADGARVVSASRDKTIRIWDGASGASLAVLRGHQLEVTCAVFSPDGRRVASGSEDRTVCLWDLATGQRLHVLEGHEDWVTSVAFSPDGTRLASASRDKTLRMWDVASGSCLGLFKHDGMVTSVSFSPDGVHLASGTFNRAIHMWDVAGNPRLSPFLGHQDWVTSVAFSPDGTRLISGSWDHTVRVWDTASGKCLDVLRGHDHRVTCVAYCPMGTCLASGSTNDTVRTWDVVTGACLRVLTGHRNSITSIAFSPDGTRLVSASEDETLRLWDAASGICLGTLGGRALAVKSVALSEDGTRIVSVVEDKTIHAWDKTSGALLEVSAEDRAFGAKSLQPSMQSHISGLHTFQYTTLGDGTELDIAFLPDGGYVVLERKPEGKWRLARARGEYWKYVNYAGNVLPDGTPCKDRVLYSADIFGPVPER